MRYWRRQRVPLTDGDRLRILYSPSNYTPALAVDATDLEDLTAHLRGIDVALAAGPSVPDNWVTHGPTPDNLVTHGGTFDNMVTH